MGMQERVRVAQDLQVDPPEIRVQPPAGPLDRLSEPVHVGQEGQPLGSRQLGQPLNTGLVHEQHRIAGQELHITDHREAGVQPPHHGRILTSQSRADPVRPPVTDHEPTLPTGTRPVGCSSASVTEASDAG
ncbi:hypothetical protein GCM10010510_49210 [Streptomyces anandii JCM 4720]|nr:hypothetical protein GCM10010510_49210 [Streptomyces anandii JCM 4720]